MPRFHSHIFYEIYFLYKGRRTFFFENSFYELEGPIILIVPPHTVHKTEGSAFERFNIYVTPEFLNDFERDILDEKAILLKESDVKISIPEYISLDIAKKNKAIPFEIESGRIKVCFADTTNYKSIDTIRLLLLNKGLIMEKYITF